MHVLDQLKGDAYVVADTIDLWIDTERNALLELIKRINLFVINDTEAEQLTEENNIIKAGSKLRELGPETVIIKKGEHGALFHEEGSFRLTCLPRYRITGPHWCRRLVCGALIADWPLKTAVILKRLKKPFFTEPVQPA